jgi:hypothetical protein
MALSFTSNVLGGHYALTVTTPIKPGAEPELRSYLESLTEHDSPFARLPRTHFGRWVIVPAFVKDPSQRREEDLGGPLLIFSVTFDGDLDSYLEELVTVLAAESARIWGSCIGAPAPAGGEALKAYLRHNQLQTGVFFSAYPQATVRDVRTGLDRRARTIAFAIRAQAMSPQDAHEAFLEAF